MEDHKEFDNEDSSPCLSLETVREYLEQQGGMVRQADLVDRFKSELNNLNTKSCARQEFKDILQVITAVKIENGEKFIILTKQEHDHFQSSLVTRKSKRFRLCSERQELLSKHKSDSTAALLKTSNQEKNLLNKENRVSGSLTVGYSFSHNSSFDESTTFLDTNKRLSDLSIDTTDSGTHCLDSDDEELEDDIGLKNLKPISELEKDWFLASSMGNIEKMKVLFGECEALLNSTDFVQGYTALHWATKLNRTDIIDFVVSNGCNIETKSHGGCTPLHVAAMSGKDDAITCLLSHGANTHARDYGGRKPKDVVKSSVEEHIQRKLGKIVIEKWSTTNLTFQRNTKVRRSSVPFFRQSRALELNDSDSFQWGFDTLQRSMTLLKSRMASPLSPSRKSLHMQSLDGDKGDYMKIGRDAKSKNVNDSESTDKTFHLAEYSIVI